MEIDVIIPLYKPGKELFTLLDTRSDPAEHRRKIF